MLRCLAFLLSLTLLTVSLQPAFAALHETEQKQAKCCNSEGCGKNATSEDQSKDTATDKACNPLMSCCACVGFTPSYVAFSLDLTFEETRSVLGYDFSAITAPAPPIWQPPKVS